MASPFKSLAEALKKPQVHGPVAALGLGLVAGGIGYLLLGRVLDAVIVGLAVAIVVLMVVVLRAVFAWEKEDRRAHGTEAPAARGAAAGVAAAAGPGSLEEAVRRAVAEIKGSRLGAGGIEALPWILLLGEAGEGKTAAVRESGLELPAEYANRVSGAATRDCDWWLANDAILLDLAGRFAACADDATHGEWISLLKQVRRQRPGCALNGVVFAISVDRLLGRSAAELEEAARSLRLRLNELTFELGVDLPVYVMLTKADHIEGFVECFAASPVVDAGSALGWSNDQRQLANAEERVVQGFRGILARLESVLPELILREPDRSRRRRIHAFPQELDEVVRAAARFIGRAFAPSAYDSAPFLRGVYLTSARRQGATVSPQLHRLGHDWARNPVEGSRVSGGVFLRDLFQEIVIGDRDLALPADRFGPRARRVVHLSAGFVALALAGWWGVAFASNLAGILTLRREAASVIAGASSLAGLEATRNAIHAQEADMRILRRGGLGGPMQTALARARQSFAWGFGREFEVPTKMKLQAVVRGFDDGAFEGLAQLAVDVTWLGSRADEAVSARPDLSRYAPISASSADAAALRSGYDDFVRWIGHDEIQDRIDRERKLVAAGSARLLELRRLETWSASSTSYPPARYADVGLPATEDPAGEVPGAYTRRGWDGLVAGLIAAIDSTGPASSVVQQFRDGYVSRYEGNWRGYLMSTPTPVRASAEVKTSPYLKLVDQIHFNASVELPRSGPAPAWLLVLREARREEPLPDAGEAGKKQEGEQAGEAAPPPDPPWKRYRLALDQVASDVQAAEEDPAAAVEMAKDLASRKPTNFSKALKLVGEIVPAEGDPEAAEKIRKLLSMPVLDGASAVLGRALDELDGRWEARIARPYAGALSGKDMAALYDSQGALAQFRSGELAAFYRDGAAVEVIGDRSLPLGHGFLAWMRGAEKLQRGLYAGGGGGGAKVAVRMQGVPSRVSGREQVRVAQRELRLRCNDGVQTFAYREGTAEHVFQWSPDCSELSLRIFAVEGGRELKPAREWTGPMAFPAFLQEGRRNGADLQWTLRYEDPDLSVVMAYRLRGGDELLSLSHGAPPGSLRN